MKPESQIISYTINATRLANNYIYVYTTTVTGNTDEAALEEKLRLLDGSYPEASEILSKFRK